MNRATAKALSEVLDFCDFMLVELAGTCPDPEEEQRVQQAVTTIRTWACGQKEFARLIAEE
jgi:hypothetical protein